MSVMKLSDRNRAIQEMMTDGDGIKSFYRFVAQNPHISLHDACQIIITRQNAGICFSFEEWNALGRRVTKGRKGIPYYDNDGNKQFVFDVSDTHGDTRYRRAITPMKKMLDGLDLINGTSLAESGRGDYRILLSGVVNYLNQNDYFTEYDEDRNRLIAEGVTYSLYAKTGFPKDYGITLKGYPYSLTENAELFKAIQRTTASLQQEIEDAITNKANEVPVIDDTEEDYISDEPIIKSESERKLAEIHSAAYSQYDGYDVLLRYTDTSVPNSPVEVYLGRKENYDNRGHYDNTDNSLLFVSDRTMLFNLLSKDAGWVLSQEEMVKGGHFTAEDYKAYHELTNGLLAEYPKLSEPMFSVDMPNTTSYVNYTSGSPLTELGTYSFYCIDNSNNESQIYTISLADAHVHSYSASVISPTCTGSGYTLHSCSCGASYTDNDTSPLGHNYSDWTMVNATSCTSSGTRKAYCTRCNQTKTETVTSLGHSYTELVSSTGNSCTSAGTSVYKCSRCASTQTVTGTALGHNYRATTTAATCTNGGYTTNTCSRCGDSYTSNLTSVLGHNYIRSIAEATCTDGGGVKHTCSRCYDSYMTDVTLPLGHAYVESVIEPTCTAKGFVLHSCARCGNEYKTDEVLPTGHQYSSNVITTASCEGTGERYHSCEYCGDNYTTQIAATGHNYEIVQENNQNGTIYRVYACSVCGNSYTEELGEQYAEVSNYVVYLMDEYKPYMVWVFLATAGVWSIAMGVAMIIAHKNEDKEKAKKMLVNYLVGMVAIFCILVACPFLVRGIAVLVS